MHNGRPGRFDRGGRRYEHVLDGDGHLIKFVVDGKQQRAHISNAFVKTDEFIAEQARDDILYRSTFGTQPLGLADNFMNLQLKNQANTNIQWCAGRLLALWEAGLPWRVNPWTLETEGADLLDGCVRGAPGALTVTTGHLPTPKSSPRKTSLPRSCQSGSYLLKAPAYLLAGLDTVDEALKLGRAFTAHPHRCAASGRMVGWSWAQNPATNSLSMTLVEWDEASEQEVTRKHYSMPDTSMAPHDFAVTESYYIFVINQISLDLVPYVAGLKGPAQCLSCTGQGVQVHLVPRPHGAAAGTDAVVIKTDDAWFNIHHATAIEEWQGQAAQGAAAQGGQASRLVVFCTGWDSASKGPFLSDWGGVVPLYDKVPAAFLFKLEIDVAARRVERTKLTGHCEHAHVHPDFEARDACRYVYVSAANTYGIPSPPNAWLRYDTHTDGTAMWCAPARQFVEELVVIPKRAAGERDAAEDTADAWLVGMIYCAQRRQSCLAILDA